MNWDRIDLIFFFIWVINGIILGFFYHMFTQYHWLEVFNIYITRERPVPIVESSVNDTLLVDTLYAEIVVGIWLVLILFDDFFKNSVFMQFIVVVYFFKFFITYKMLNIKKLLFNIVVFIIIILFILFFVMIGVNLVYLM